MQSVRAMTYQARMAKEPQIWALFKAADKELGSLHDLVNNVGITRKFCCVYELNHATTQRVMDIDIIGCMMVIRKAGRRMSTAHGGTGGVLLTFHQLQHV
jgi:NAD(P)-dependent dehydrogenase (short-subunit alcohol dehydrogenase family)